MNLVPQPPRGQSAFPTPREFPEPLTPGRYRARSGTTASTREAERAIVDIGMPLGNGASIAKGSVAKSTSKIVGYSILQGESTKAVTDLLERHPPGFTMEVLEILPMPGM